MKKYILSTLFISFCLLGIQSVFGQGNQISKSLKIVWDFFKAMPINAKYNKTIFETKITPKFLDEFDKADIRTKEAFFESIPFEYRSPFLLKLNPDILSKSFLFESSSNGLPPVISNRAGSLDAPLFLKFKSMETTWLSDKKFKPEVLTTQKYLNEKYKLSLKEDGIYGTNTEQAIKNYIKPNTDESDWFQKSYNRINIESDVKFTLQELSRWKGFHGDRNQVLALFKFDTKLEYLLHYNFLEVFFSKINYNENSKFEKTLMSLFYEIEGKQFQTNIWWDNKNNKFKGYSLEAKPLNTDGKKSLQRAICDTCRYQKLIIYSDFLTDKVKDILNLSKENNIPVICRNSNLDLPMYLIEDNISTFLSKKINFEQLSILNGIPITVKEAEFQDFPLSSIDLYKDLANKLNSTLIDKSENKSKIITNKKDLINEFTNGNDDILLLIAHSDGNSIYFGQEKITINEVTQLKNRKNRTTKRVAILLSCTTGNVIKEKPKWYQFFQAHKETKSFSEILLEKGFFDMVLAPNNEINGEEVLKMVQDIDKYNIIELRNLFHKFAEESIFFNIAKK